MRKFICLVLALLMLPCAALADAADAAVSYTHPDYGYTLSIPADWLVMDAYNIDSLIEAATNGELEGFDPAALEEQKEQIVSQNLMMAISDDGFDNMNVIVSDLGMPFTVEDVVAYICPQVGTQYASMFEGCVIEDEGSVANLAGRDFARLTMTYPVAPLALRMHQYIAVEGTVMYCLTFVDTGIGEACTVEYLDDICSAFIETLVLPAAEAETDAAA